MGKIENIYQDFNFEIPINDKGKIYLDEVESETQKLVDIWLRSRQREGEGEAVRRNFTVPEKSDIQKKAERWELIAKITYSAAMVSLVVMGAAPIFISAALASPLIIAIASLAAFTLSLSMVAFVNMNGYWRMKRVINYCDENKRTDFKFFMQKYFSEEQLKHISEKDLKDLRLHKIYEYWSIKTQVAHSLAYDKSRPSVYSFFKYASAAFLEGYAQERVKRDYWSVDHPWTG